MNDLKEHIEMLKEELTAAEEQLKKRGKDKYQGRRESSPPPGNSWLLPPTFFYSPVWFWR